MLVAPRATGANLQINSVCVEALRLNGQVYEETLEDNGRFNEQPALPFNAYGTMALARSEFETNSGSSQFFFLLKVGPKHETVV